MAKKAKATCDRRRCDECGQIIEVDDGKLATHGPGRDGSFICPGSGDKGMVEAGRFKID
jgi:hypothetical protein